MGRRPLLQKDVVEIAHKHAYEKNRAVASNLVIYTLDNLFKHDKLSDEDAIKRLKELGYSRERVAEDTVVCARACIKFHEALVEKGYAWDDWYGKLLAPTIPKVV
jgi:hypothetical protein